MSAILDLADLAAEQWGLVTTAQARSLGVSAQAVARLADQGTLERLTHGVYRVSGAPPEPLDELRAAWLILDPGRRSSERLRDSSPPMISHRSAALLHGLGDLDADEHEFTAATRKQSRRTDVRLHRSHVGRDDWTVVDGLPVTSVLRTVSDLAAARIDGGHLASVVRDALTLKGVDDQRLAEVLRSHASHYGAPRSNGLALLSRLLQESGVPESLRRAVELASSGNVSALDASARAHSSELQQLRERLASIKQAVAPALPASSGVRVDLAFPETDVLTEMSHLADLIWSAVSTPDFQQLMAERTGGTQL